MNFLNGDIPFVYIATVTQCSFFFAGNYFDPEEGSS
jgi:hypothetical protein